MATDSESARHIAVIQADTPLTLVTTVKWPYIYKTYTNILILMYLGLLGLNNGYCIYIGVLFQI